MDLEEYEQYQKDFEALYDATNAGDLDRVRRVVEGNKTSTLPGGDAALHDAIRKGYVNIAKYLLEDKRAKPSPSALETAVFARHRDIVIALLRDGRVDPARNDSGSLRQAVDLGDQALVKVLLADGRADPNQCHALVLAASRGFDGIVELLLQDGREDPMGWESTPMYHACTRGYLSIVKLLLADPRVNPAYKDSMFLKTAVVNNHVDVVEELLADGRADPRVVSVLREAVLNNNLDMVRALLRDGRADPSEDHNICIRQAVRNDNLDMVRMLLLDGRADPSKDNNLCIREAIQKGNTAIVEALLADPRTTYGNGDIIEAAKRQHYHIVRMLVANEKCRDRDTLFTTVRPVTNEIGLAALAEEGISMDRADPEVLAELSPTHRQLIFSRVSNPITMYRVGENNPDVFLEIAKDTPNEVFEALPGFPASLRPHLAWRTRAPWVSAVLRSIFSKHLNSTTSHEGEEDEGAPFRKWPRPGDDDEE
jgi:ankyrin repeat protein